MCAHYACVAYAVCAANQSIAELYCCKECDRWRKNVNDGKLKLHERMKEWKNDHLYCEMLFNGRKFESFLYFSVQGKWVWKCWKIDNFFLHSVPHGNGNVKNIHANWKVRSRKWKAESGIASDSMQCFLKIVRDEGNDILKKVPFTGFMTLQSVHSVHSGLTGGVAASWATRVSSQGEPSRAEVEHCQWTLTERCHWTRPTHLGSGSPPGFIPTFQFQFSLF